jgi:exopolyphosphatase/guanosine-5'-triphosphate,3'-diphosphate pyrophosphatase
MPSPAARVAAIDIGTNSVLLTVAEGAAESPRPVLERARITRLGQGVDRTRALAPEAITRTLAVIEDYARELATANVSSLAVVGTSALRDAGGGPELCDAIERTLGTRPRVIAGEEEAELTFHGALSGLPGTAPANEPVLVFDVGGGSTEIIHGTPGGQPSLAVSLDVGSVRLTERHVLSDPPAAAELAAVSADVQRELTKLAQPRDVNRVVAVAGTVTTLAAVDLGLARYDAGRVHGHVLTRAALDALTTRLAGATAALRREMPGLEPGRADVICAGAIIVREVLAWTGANELAVSDRGVRWGLITRLLSEAFPERA